MTTDELLIHVQPTPNPKALKFIVNADILKTGKATFSTKEEAQSLKLAQDLYSVSGVTQLHFFENFITVTFDEATDPNLYESDICAIIRRDLPIHNPNFELESLKPKKPKPTDPDLLKIETILDRTIRPGLQGDGGDIEVISYKNNVLEVNYQGACGTCPSASSGTLMAIESILRDEFNPEIKVEVIF